MGVDRPPEGVGAAIDVGQARGEIGGQRDYSAVNGLDASQETDAVPGEAAEVERAPAVVAGNVAEPARVDPVAQQEGGEVRRHVPPEHVPAPVAAEREAAEP